MSKRGIYVSLEGIDGVGKSTAVRGAYGALCAVGISCTVIVEPTDGPNGKEIRHRAKAGDVDPAELLELFMADREELAPKIEELLMTHDVVLSDRSYYSTAAYQAHGEWTIERIIERAQAFMPSIDLLILLEAPLSVCAERRNERDGVTGDALEKDLRMVRRRYRHMYKAR